MGADYHLRDREQAGRRDCIMSARIGGRKPCESTDARNGVEMALPVISGERKVRGKIRLSRMGSRRAAVLILVHVIFVIHIVHWRMAGETVSPVEPSEAMYTLRDGAVNAGFIFLAVSLLATMILGRFVCGWACHIVALQDLCGWMMKRVGVRPKPFRSRLLVFVPLVAALYMFIWPVVYRTAFAPANYQFAGFSNHLTKQNFWETFPGWAIAIPFLLICGFAVVYFLGAKGYCTYACPYGGFFGLTDKLAVGRIRVTDDCEQCGHCTATCTSNVLVHAEVRDYGMVVDPGCMKCMDCVSVCPNDALYFGFGGPSLAAKPKRQPQARTFDLTWGEEFLALGAFVIAFVAFRGLPVTRNEGIPFLMALGIAGIFAFFVIKLLHLKRRANVSIQTLRLRSGGRIRPVGLVFGALAVGFVALTAHASLVRYYQFLGDYYFNQTGGADERALANPYAKIDAPETARKAAIRADAHYRRFLKFGWVDVAETRSRLAWLNLVVGQPQEAVAMLRRAVELAPEFPGYRYQYAGALMGVGRFEEAVDEFDRFLAEMPGNSSHQKANAQLARANALAELGRLDEAITGWEALLVDYPEMVTAHHNLAGALRQQGHLARAVEQYRKALELWPDDADIHFQLGVTLSSMGRHHQASSHFQRAVELDPRYRALISGPQD